MPTHTIDFGSSLDIELGVSNTASILPRRGLQLRRSITPGGAISGTGKFWTSTDTVTVPWAPDSLTEWFGIFVRRRDSLPSANVTFQVSNDDGVTWLYWDGAAWSVALSSGDSNTVDDVAENAPTFPLSGTLKFRIILTPDPTQTITPFIEALELFVEYDYDIITNVNRSTLSLLKKEALVRQTYRETVVNAQKITVTSELTLSNDFKVYNLSVDPFRRTPLSATRSGTPVSDSNGFTEEVTLAGPPFPTGQLEVRWRASIPVHINTDPDFEPTNLPAIIVTSIRVDDAGHSSGQTFDFEPSQNRWRARFYARRLIFLLEIESEASYDRLAQDIASVIYETFAHIVEYPDLALGEFLPVIDLEPINAVHSIRSQRYRYRVNVSVAARDWPRKFLTIPALSSIFVTGTGGPIGIT